MSQRRRTCESGTLGRAKEGPVDTEVQRDSLAMGPWPAGHTAVEPRSVAVLLPQPPGEAQQ